MSPIPKSLRILLPVATATTAGIITAYLIAQQHNNLKDLKDEDQLLDNVDLETKPFEEELIENKEESEDSTKEEGGDSKPKESVEKEKPKDKPEKELSPSEGEVPNLDEMANKAVEQLAEMMDQAKDLQSVTEMQLTIPDAEQSQAPSLSKLSPSKGPEEKQSIGGSNAKKEKDLSQPSVENSAIQESQQNINVSKEEHGTNIYSSVPSTVSKEELQIDDGGGEVAETRSDESDTLSEPREETITPPKGQKDVETDLSGAEHTEDSELSERQAEETEGSSGDGSNGQDATGSDDESVAITPEQMKQLLA